MDSFYHFNHTIFAGGRPLPGTMSTWTWWRHHMETFSALLAICAGNSPVAGDLPAQRPVTRSFDVFIDLSLNKRLSKQSWGWWFETPSRPLWCHCNDTASLQGFMWALLLNTYTKLHIFFLLSLTELTHRGGVTLICVGKLGNHWFS